MPVANENDTSRITKEGITKAQYMTVIQTQIQQQVEAPDSPSAPMFLSKKEHKTFHRHTRLERELQIQDMVVHGFIPSPESKVKINNMMCVLTTTKIETWNTFSVCNFFVSQMSNVYLSYLFYF